MREMLLAKAKEYGLEPTEFFDRVIKAKERFGLVEGCPCDKDNPERYCISPLCLSDIERDKHCHCNAYKLK